MVKKIVLIFALLNLILNVFGNNWGLPSRWHADEKVANALHMLHEKTVIDTRGCFFQPTGHQIILAAWLVPYLVLLKFTGFPFNELKEAASVSWVHMAKAFPDFATAVYVYARSLSAILGAITVFVMFLIADKIYGRKAGFFSAAFLSVCMGFIAVNHFAKYSSLVNLLIALALLFCVVVVEKKIVGEAKWPFYFGAFLAGMAVSVNFGVGSMLLAVLVVTYTYILMFVVSDKNKKKVEKLRESFSITICSAGFFVLGAFLLTPSLAIPKYFKKYLLSNKTIWEGMVMEPTSFPFLNSAINNFFEIASIMGLPIFILVLAGILSRILSRKKISAKEYVIFSFFIPYLFFEIFSKGIFPQMKTIIMAVPLLAVLAGKAMSDIFKLKSINYVFKSLIFLSVFLYSLAYSYSADMVFLKGDTRYASTKWIEENIPPGSKIEIFSQIHSVCSESIVENREIIYLGQSSKNFTDGNLSRWIDIENRAQYIEKLNKSGSSADYIIINLNYLEKLYSEDYLGYLTGVDDYVKGLFEGRHNFVMVKSFAPRNRRIVFKKMGYLLIIPQNILWDPVPDYEAVSPTIYDFKRIKG